MRNLLLLLKRWLLECKQQKQQVVSDYHHYNRNASIKCVWKPSLLVCSHGYNVMTWHNIIRVLEYY